MRLSRHASRMVLMICLLCLVLGGAIYLTVHMASGLSPVPGFGRSLVTMDDVENVEQWTQWDQYEADIEFLAGAAYTPFPLMAGEAAHRLVRCSMAGSAMP